MGYYRSLLVRMYYAYTPEEKTPSPFLEMRAYVVTRKRIKWEVLKKRLNETLNKLEWIFYKVGKARLDGRIYYEVSITGEEENVPIDRDEAILSFEKTGLPEPRRIEKHLNNIYRFVIFYKRDKIFPPYIEAIIRDHQIAREEQARKGEIMTFDEFEHDVKLLGLRPEEEEY